MNVFEITEDTSNHSIWIFFVVAAVVMFFTVGAWTIWSIVLDKKLLGRDRKKVLKAISGED